MRLYSLRDAHSLIDGNTAWLRAWLAITATTLTFQEASYTATAVFDAKYANTSVSAQLYARELTLLNDVYFEKLQRSLTVSQVGIDSVLDKAK